MGNLYREEVARRAGERCEYCHFPQQFSGFRFVCDHIIAKKHGGLNTPENLAFCCPHCNSHKLDNIAGLDPSFDAPIRLFNPRRDLWSEHFRWDAGSLVGLTSIGRATVKVLLINAHHRVCARRALQTEGVRFD